MTQIELIRQEIERLKEEYNEQVSARLISESLVSMGKVEALNKVLAFIESLSEEKPSKDLEEAAEKFSFISEGVDSSGEPYKDYDSGKLEGFIAGAEWQKKQQLTWKDIQDIVETAFWVIPQNIKESEKEEYYTKLLNEYQRIKKQNKL